jgi:hypothetical protein
MADTNHIMNGSLVVTLSTRAGTTVARATCTDGAHAAREAAAMILRRAELVAGDMVLCRIATRGDIFSPHAPRATD